MLRYTNRQNPAQRHMHFMETDQFERLMAVLERIADGLQGARQPRKATASPPVAIRADQARETMLTAHAGRMVTIAEARSTLNLHGESDKAVSQLLAACGFERRRGAAGVRFAVAADPAKAGRPLEMPAMPDGAVETARKRDTPMTAKAFLNMCNNMAPQKMRITAAHIAELHRLHPGVFTD